MKSTKLFFSIFFCFTLIACSESSLQLSAPNMQTIKMSGGIVSWNEVPNAYGYELKIEQLPDILQTGKPEYNLLPKLEGYNLLENNESITFECQLRSIAAPGSAYTNSAWTISTQLTYTMSDSIGYLDDSAHVSYQASSKTLIFDLVKAGNLKNSLLYPDRYRDGVLTVHPIEGGREIEKILFKGSGSSSIINGLCIKIPNDWISVPTIIFENMVFESSKSLPLIDSSVNVIIEYKGYNQLSSSANDAISLIQVHNNTIALKPADDDSRFTLKTNEVKNSEKGSIGIKADKVIIDGGVFKIIGSNGKINGGDGSTGIEANTTTIRGNAVVNITAGNGADGSQGISGRNGEPGRNNDFPWSKAGNGANGINGGAGGNGGDGGDAIHGDLVFESSTCTVKLKGGDGGNGGKGGNGGDGGNGGTATAWWSTGGNGGKGGDGGNGGRGGNGGNAVSGRVTNQNSESSFSGGKGGTGGAGGTKGTGGSGGKANHDAGGGQNGRPGEPGIPGVSGVNGTPGKAITG